MNETGERNIPDEVVEETHDVVESSQEMVERDRERNESVLAEARSVLEQAQSIIGEKGDYPLYTKTNKSINNLVGTFEELGLAHVGMFKTLLEAQDSFKRRSHGVLGSVEEVVSRLDSVTEESTVLNKEVADSMNEGFDGLDREFSRIRSTDDDVRRYLRRLTNWADSGADERFSTEYARDTIHYAVRRVGNAMGEDGEALRKFTRRVGELAHAADKITSRAESKVAEESEKIESPETPEAALDLLRKTQENALIAKSWIDAGAPFMALQESGGDPASFRYGEKGEALDLLVDVMEDSIDAAEIYKPEKEGELQTGYAEMLSAIREADTSVDELLNSVDELLADEPSVQEANQTEDMWLRLIGESGPGANHDDASVLEPLPGSKFGTGKVIDAEYTIVDDEEGLEELELDDDSEQIEFDTRARPAEFAGEYYTGDEEDDDEEEEEEEIELMADDEDGLEEIELDDDEDDDPLAVALEGKKISESAQQEVRDAMTESLSSDKEKGFFGKVGGWMAGRALGLMTLGVSESIQAKKFESATKDEAERLEDVMNSLEGLGPMAQEWREISGDTRSLSEIYSENAGIIRNEINQSVQNLEVRLLEAKRMMGLTAGPYKDQFGQKIMAMESRVNAFKISMEEQFHSELNADKALTEHQIYVGLNNKGEPAPRPSEVLVTKKEFRGEMRKALDKTWWHRKVYSALEKIPWMAAVSFPGIAEAPTLPAGVPDISPSLDLIPDSVSRNLDGTIWNTVKQYALEAGVELDSLQLVELSKQVSADNMVDVPVWNLSGGAQLHTKMQPQMIVLDSVDKYLLTL